MTNGKNLIGTKLAVLLLIIRITPVLRHSRLTDPAFAGFATVAPLWRARAERLGMTLQPAAT
jgi:hypothetical protein